MNKNGSLGLIVACAVGAAALITVLVHGGWTVWIPTLLALAVVYRVWQALGR